MFVKIHSKWCDERAVTMAIDWGCSEMKSFGWWLSCEFQDLEIVLANKHHHSLELEMKRKRPRFSVLVPHWNRHEISIGDTSCFLQILPYVTSTSNLGLSLGCIQSHPLPILKRLGRLILSDLANPKFTCRENPSKKSCSHGQVWCTVRSSSEIWLWNERWWSVKKVW